MTLPSSRADRTLLVLLFLAFLLRMAAVPINLRMAERRGIRFYDEYGGIAQNIVEGHGFSYAWQGPLRPTSIHAPLYPYLLAGMFTVFGIDRAAPAVIILNILISIGLLWHVHGFLRRNFGAGPALLGLAILVFLPTQIYYSSSGLPTVLYATGLSLVMMQAWRTWHKPDAANGALWGLLIGGCALSYSFVLVLVPFLVLWLILSVPAPRRTLAFSAAAIAVAVAILMCVPWTIRNYHVHGRWILIRDQGGINLWWGNQQYATGGAMDKRGICLGTIPPEASKVMEAFDNEVDADRYMGRLAREEMRANPGRTMALWARKIGMFWWFTSGPRTAGLGIEQVMPVLMLSKGLLLLFSGWGMILLASRHRALAVLILIVCLSITFVHMVFHAGNIRYFFPLEPILAGPAGLAAAALLSRKGTWLRRITGEVAA